MKSHLPSRGFTLFEVMIALMIFSVAVVSLVGAINAMGNASSEARHSREIMTKLESLLTEATRTVPQNLAPNTQPDDKKVSENGVDYLIKMSPITLSNKDGQQLQSILTVKVTARWKDGGHVEEMSADTLVYPPLYAPSF